jgi:hypothetical protein
MQPSHPFETVNIRFYQAFAEADFDAMNRLWAASLPVSCLHPGALPLLGRREILDSWRQILLQGGRIDITFRPQQMSLVGQIGVACGLELLGGGRIACTNLFALEDGDWKIVHHQGGPVIPANRQATAHSPQRGNITRH